MEGKLKSIEKELREGLLASLKEAAREFIGQHLAPKLDKTLQILNWGGLSDVHDRLLVVRTHARDDLESLVKRMGAGTIGIAGPRGSGKSTLLNWLTSPEGDDVPAKKHRLCIRATAPIRYDGRDFILYLFSDLCHAVLERCGISRNDLRTMDREAPIPDWSKSSRLIRVTLRIGPQLTMIFGVLLLIGAIFGLFLQFEPKSQTGAAVHQQATRIVVPEGPSTSHNTTAKTAGQTGQPDAKSDTHNDHSTGAEAVSAKSDQTERAKTKSTSTTPSPPSPTDAHPAATAKLSGSSKTFLDFMIKSKGDLFKFGMALFAIALVLQLFGRRLWQLVPGLTYVSPFEALLASQSLDESKQRLARIGYDHIQNIRFQHSYSAGWKGSLSLPYVTAEHTTAKTLSQNQRTLPDIVTDFRRFVEMARNDLGLDQPIMIAIDEMDKMKTPQDAEVFLNDIKAIFSIPHCIYLVSISENAMSSFERRGLPLRDTFDSSFHEVVRVKYLNVEESIRLLDRRVIGLPRPFQGLCHCLSGGLARDLVRTARKLPFEDQGQSLAKVKERLIHEEINGKLDAVQIVISNLTVEPQLRNFVSLLRILRTKKLNDAQKITSKLWEVGLPNLLTDNNDAAEVQDQVSTISDLGRELASYVYYLDSVDKLFDKKPNKSMFAIDGPVDQLARARQELEVNPWIAWERISEFRDMKGLAQWTLPEAKVAISSTYAENSTDGKRESIKEDGDQ